MARHREYLEKKFIDEQKVSEKSHNYWSKYLSLGEAAMVEYTFNLGMQIAIETLTEQ